MSHKTPSPNRRDFITGQSIRAASQQVGDAIADRIEDAASRLRPMPAAGGTVRLGVKAMACDFAVILNPSPELDIEAASAALEMVERLEDQLSVYREQSEISQINNQAADGAVAVECEMFRLLQLAKRLATETEGAFDPTSGQLVTLWRHRRDAGRIPSSEEIAETLQRIGFDQLELDEDAGTIRFRQPGIELNLGGIGKGYALDRAGQVMIDGGVDHWLIHGGHSSILARGDHNQLGGWPIGIANPLFPGKQLATVILKNQAFSASGTAVQHFRLEGRRYGHILDPRTGWPSEDILSVAVIAQTAAEADALSTAFFVLGVEKTVEFCHNHPGVAALLIPPPRRNRKLAPINCGISNEVLFFNPDVDLIAPTSLTPLPNKDIEESSL